MAAPPTSPAAAPPSGAPGAPADLSIGCFSDQAPWIVDPDHMPWREVVDEIRWLTRHDLHDLWGRLAGPPQKKCGTARNERYAEKNDLRSLHRRVPIGARSGAPRNLGRQRFN